ncbi:hypothetical protein ABEB36_015577 [Hypothenemus hampei]|uniref:Uncharacterized protein n=1 Tax=Hypothenemus hampei TaxID=57062 RepID=A0ABD1DZK1_HYPHA
MRISLMRIPNELTTWGCFFHLQGGLQDRARLPNLLWYQHRLGSSLLSFTRLGQGLDCARSVWPLRWNFITSTCCDSSDTICSSSIILLEDAFTSKAWGCSIPANSSARDASLGRVRLLETNTICTGAGNCCSHSDLRTFSETRSPPSLFISLSNWEGFLSPRVISDSNFRSFSESVIENCLISLSLMPSYTLSAGGLRM